MQTTSAFLAFASFHFSFEAICLVVCTNDLWLTGFQFDLFCDIVYDQNHYSGLNPIPKPLFWFKSNTETQIGRYFLPDTVTDPETTFQSGDLVTNSLGYFFSVIKGPLKLNLLPSIECF